MTVPTQPLPTVGQPNSTEDPKVRSALAELQTILTAGVDTTNIAAAAGITAAQLAAGAVTSTKWSPTIDIASGGSSALGTAEADVTGASITINPTATTRAFCIGLIRGYIEDSSPGLTQDIDLYLSADGVNQAHVPRVEAQELPADSFSYVGYQLTGLWLVTGLVAGARIIKLRAKESQSSSITTINQSQLVVIQFV